MHRRLCNATQSRRRTQAEFVARMEPPGPALGRPDDKLSGIRAGVASRRYRSRITWSLSSGRPTRSASGPARWQALAGPGGSMRATRPGWGTLRPTVQLLISRSSTSNKMAPTVEVTMALMGKPPIGGRRSTSHNQVPIYPPITPTMISPIRPKPVFFRTLAASQPAIAPMTSVTLKLSIAVSPRKPPANRRQHADHARRGHYGFFGPTQVVSVLYRPPACPRRNRRHRPMRRVLPSEPQQSRPKHVGVANDRKRRNKLWGY